MATENAQRVRVLIGKSQPVTPLIQSLLICPEYKFDISVTVRHEEKKPAQILQSFDQ